jgi:hypothetical protein
MVKRSVRATIEPNSPQDGGGTEPDEDYGRLRDLFALLNVQFFDTLVLRKGARIGRKKKGKLEKRN